MRRAIQCGIEVESVFVPHASSNANLVAQESDDNSPNVDQHILEWLPWSSNDAVNFEVFSVEPRAFEKISFGNRHEVVAVARTPVRRLDMLNLPRPATIAVLERIEKPGNIGAVMRSADGAGLDAVVLVDCVSDVFNPNAIRASLGTIFAMPLAETTFGEFRAWSSEIEMHCLLAKCDATSFSFNDDELYKDLDSSSLAIVLGSESQGLSARWDSLPRLQNVAIPMAGIADSLNISAAAAVFFYTIRGNRPAERTTSTFHLK